MANQRNLKAFVRYDGSGRVVAGSLVLRRKKPKVGNWKEVPAYESAGSTEPTEPTGPIVASINVITSMNQGDVCMDFGSGDTYYYDESIQPLGVGTTLFRDAALTMPASYDPSGYNSTSFSMKESGSGSGYNVENTIITEVFNCV